MEVDDRMVIRMGIVQLELYRITAKIDARILRFVVKVCMWEGLKTVWYPQQIKITIKNCVL
jgi:hypothetical protein